MTTLWIEIRKTVQIYADPFFASMEALKEYTDVSLIKNRIQLFESLFELMADYTIHDYTFGFSIATTNGKTVDTSMLQPEVQPTLGHEFVNDGDFHTIDLIKKRTTDEMYEHAGVFFQEIIMYGISGYNMRTMQYCNPSNRESMLSMFQQMCRLPETIGLVHIRISPKTGRRRVVQNQEIRSKPGLRLFQHLAVHKPPAPLRHPNGTSCSSDTPPQQSESDGLLLHSSRSGTGHEAQQVGGGVSETKKRHREEVDNWPTDDIAFSQCRISKRSLTNAHFRSELPMSPLPVMPTRVLAATRSTPQARGSPPGPPAVPPILASPHSRHKWSTDHPLVGTQISAERSFVSSENAPHSSPVVCKGVVTAFSALSGDPIFRVKWDDSRLSKEEMSRAQVLEASRLFDEIEGWTTSNPSVGQRVAGIFPHQRHTPSNTLGKIVPLSRSQDVYLGTVVKYQHSSSAQAGDQLYHVMWCDGDGEDYDQTQLHDAQALYLDHRNKFST